MNRKDRRAAQKGKGGGSFGPGGRSGPGLSPNALPANLFAGAVQKFRAGEIGEAERLCRDVLIFEPSHGDALHLLGMIAFQVGRHDVAEELIGRAIAINPRNADAYFNLAQICRARGRIDEAASHLAQTTALKRDHVAAHLQLADLCLQHGRLDEAVTRYRRALALKPDQAEACSNLGVALAALGRWDDAAAAYQRALALKPDLVDVYRNLGRVLLSQGDAGQALTLARRGLAVKETEEGRIFFVQCARSAPAAVVDQDFRALVARALTEGWNRPRELSALAADLFKRGDAGRAWFEPRAAPPAGPPPDDATLAAVADDQLLQALLQSAPVCDIALERFLTAVRRALLERAATASAHDPSDEQTLRLFCALAQQCFINEYVFAETEDEGREVEHLQQTLAAALAWKDAIPSLALAALAAYRPLHSLPQAALLLERSWPDVVAPLIAAQVREPFEERELREKIPALTPIDDAVSLKVQQQYEEMPYPRWIRPAPVGRPNTIEWYLRNQFPHAPLAGSLPRERLDVLIAGCGTGQHAIESARRFAGARVLAIDLSRTSLAYAVRKTRELALETVDYAQADILKLAAVGHTFDLIELSGVLHHLADPVAGWRVLLSLLRPGGVMNVGLYSAVARTQIRAARAFIAERGYGDTADAIRRCRQEITALSDDVPLREVVRYPDFFSTSECRDLLFHVQEHQVTIPAIKAFLDAHGLAFLGFSGQPAVEFRKQVSDEHAATDLDQWHLFEMGNPAAFVSMYQFWVQKR